MNEKQIFEQSRGLMLLAQQALSSLSSNLFMTVNCGPIILYLAAIVSSMCKTIVILLDLVETCRLIYSRKRDNERGGTARQHSLAVRCQSISAPSLFSPASLCCLESRPT